ncbi:MBOAT family O-acyltransferase [Halopseudomonas salegens]|uniref:Probable alginate O-acetylase n=1 Tax=Halopseudomonas salegens TaxID=1434072 RepID=A0A1H2HVP2_9GAMM|nr:MBOAT family O-acyltransferase [Halopseudomonas salegens]SDU35960.1 D-alanyl-lipoteichoic acid acyltransferase DltB, MBOAT superfamily [Halopseudomonas salegens]
MQFDSLTFIGFMLAVLLLYNCIGQWAGKKNLLLLASYTFYASWNPLFLPLLMVTTTLDWWMAKRMHMATGRARKAWLWAIVLISLGVLGYFKYSYFVLQNTHRLLDILGVGYTPQYFDVILPIGISFYTFHSLSYCIDVYRRKFPPVANWRDYALYVSFFPQLVAGPIVRWSEMREQIEQPRSVDITMLGIGVLLIVLGLFQKVVLADGIFAPVANLYFAPDAALSMQTAWIAALAFTGQIFCDFSGYTTCALGAALMLGFRLPVNFINPYAAVGFSDFWRRWHISLSSWLRDYLYIGLGGNRLGRWMTYRNLMLTMLLGGLWHGAAWTFVIWGGLHGALLIAERWLQAGIAPLQESFTWLLKPLGWLLTFLLLVVTWVWFRAEGVTSAWTILQTMFTISGASSLTAGLRSADSLALAGIAGLVIGQCWLGRRSLHAQLMRLPAPLLGGIVALLAAAIMLSAGESHAFIYFQF